RKRSARRLAVLDLRTGQTEATDLDRPHDAVAHQAALDVAEALGDLPAAPGAQEEAVDHAHRDAAPQHDDHAGAQHGGELRADQRQEQHAHHDPQSDLEEARRDVPARVYYVPHEPPLRAAMLSRHLPLVPGHEGVLRLPALPVRPLPVATTRL